MYIAKFTLNHVKMDIDYWIYVSICETPRPPAPHKHTEETSNKREQIKVITETCMISFVLAILNWILVLI